MTRKKYEKALRKLQVRLCHLQRWVKDEGVRVVIVFEGRDERGQRRDDPRDHRSVSPRVFRIVAVARSVRPREVPAVHAALPAALSPRPARWSSSIAAGTTAPASERVMGFCTPREHKRFLQLCPLMEKFMVDGGHSP
jgi:polyphosphate kinase 2 (PPK2 family)